MPNVDSLSVLKDNLVNSTAKYCSDANSVSSVINGSHSTGHFCLTWLRVMTALLRYHAASVIPLQSIVVASFWLYILHPSKLLDVAPKRRTTSSAWRTQYWVVRKGMTRGASCWEVAPRLRLSKYSHEAHKVTRMTVRFTSGHSCGFVNFVADTKVTRSRSSLRRPRMFGRSPVEGADHIGSISDWASWRSSRSVVL